MNFLSLFKSNKINTLKTTTTITTNNTTFLNKTIPKHLQKDILLLLCRFINYNTKTKDLFNKYFNEPNSIVEINKLIITLSLVNKEWFQYVSNSIQIFEFDHFEKIINLCIKNHGKTSKSKSKSKNSIDNSILKIENCKLLKINSDLNITSILADKIIELSTTSLLIKNVGPDKKMNLLLLLYKLNQFKIKNEINLGLLLLDPIENQDESFLNILIKNNVKKVNTIKIYKFEDELVILKVFSTWKHSIKKIILSGFKYYSFNVFQVLSPRQETGNINYLENIQSISISRSNGLSLDTIISVLNNTHNLKELDISLCFQTLIFNLSTTEQEIKSLKLSRCSICPFIEDTRNVHTNYSKYVIDNWYILCELFKSNKTLQHLSIHCTCDHFYVVNKTKCQKLVLEISNLVSSIGSLNKFSLKSTNYPEIFKSIIEKNNSITHFYSLINNSLKGNNEEEINRSKSIFNDLILRNSHIISFKFENYYNETCTSKDILINFNKK